MNLRNLLCFTLKTIDLLSSLLSFAHARLRVVSLAWVAWEYLYPCLEGRTMWKYTLNQYTVIMKYHEFCWELPSEAP
jgi:hypothetical protein